MFLLLFLNCLLPVSRDGYQGEAGREGLMRDYTDEAGSEVVSLIKIFTKLL